MRIPVPYRPLRLDRAIGADDPRPRAAGDGTKPTPARTTGPRGWSDWLRQLEAQLDDHERAYLRRRLGEVTAERRERLVQLSPADAAAGLRRELADAPGRRAVSDAAVTARDLVELVVNGKRYSGWKSVRVTRSIESLAGSFALDVSDRWDGASAPWPIVEGNACRVEIDTGLLSQGSN